MTDGTRLVRRCKEFWRQAAEHEAHDHLDAAWACMEAAHILGQGKTRLHVASHFHMLMLALRTRQVSELMGQAARLVASVLITWVWVPVGNNGRANVSALSTAPIPRDLQSSD